MVNQTRYQRPLFHPLPVERHPRKIWGADTLSDKRWKCWNCGFVVNTDIGKTGDGVGFQARDIVDPGIFAGGTGDKRDTALSLDDNNTIHLSQIDSEGNQIPTVGT